MSGQSAVKTVGANGQISLGRQYAGQKVLVEQSSPGVWLIRTVDAIPCSECCLHTHEHMRCLDAAIAWAESNPASQANAEAILKRLAHVDDDGE